MTEADAPNIFDAPPVEPFYRQGTPNEPILLGSFRGQLRSDNSENPVQSEVKLRFVPQQRVELHIPRPDDQPFFTRISTFLKDNALDSLSLLDHGTSVDVHCLSTSESLYSPKQVPVPILPSSRSIERATIHLQNWPRLLGSGSYVLRTGKPPLEGYKTCGRFNLEFDDWLVTIVETQETDQLVEKLEETGGFVITHVGSVRRSDGNRFSTEQLEEVLTFLTYFFSFVLGRWRGPCLAVGIDEFGARVFEEWGGRRCDAGSWTGHNSWFDSHHSQMLTATAGGFYRLWTNTVWSAPLREVIYWYLNANRGTSGLGVDSALLFSQAALELLAWTYCVLDKAMVSANAFKAGKLSAADKLRILASSLGLPLGIPQSLKSLNVLQPNGKNKWLDSMDAITDLRNGLVHPGGNRVTGSEIYFDGWRLSLWYLELIVLRLSGYSGDYSNRVLETRWIGQVEPVPWNS